MGNVGRWRYSRVSSTGPDRSSTSSSDSSGCAARSASRRARTASHAVLTAPPVTYDCREAEEDPAEPELRARDLGLDGDEPLAHLGGGGVHEHLRLVPGQLDPHPGRRVVVEALGEADVLDADAVA